MPAELTDWLRDRAARHGMTGLVFGVTYFASKLGQPRDRNNGSQRTSSLVHPRGRRAREGVRSRPLNPAGCEHAAQGLAHVMSRRPE